MATLFFVSFIIISVSLLILVLRPIILEWMKIYENKKILKNQNLHNEQIKSYAEQLNIQDEKFNDIHKLMNDFIKNEQVNTNKKEAILKYLIEETKDENKKQEYMDELKKLFIKEKDENTKQS